jgi:hypothetical protein
MRPPLLHERPDVERDIDVSWPGRTLVVHHAQDDRGVMRHVVKRHLACEQLTSRWYMSYDRLKEQYARTSRQRHPNEYMSLA